MNKETEDVCENILCEICWLICPLKFPLVKMLVHLNVHDHHPIWTYFCDFSRRDCWAISISYLQLERIHLSIHVFFHTRSFQCTVYVSVVTAGIRQINPYIVFFPFYV